MKRTLLLILPTLMIINEKLHAQPTGGGVVKCANDIYLQQVIKKYPSYTKTINASNQLLTREVKKKLQLKKLNRNFSVSSGPVIIPVVVHIVLPDPGSVTDMEVQQQIDRLNADFSGLN